MVVNHCIGTLNSQITVEFHLLARDTAAVCHSLSHRYVAQLQRLHFVQRLASVGNGQVQDVLSQFHEISVLSHEVSFALQSDDHGKVAGCLSQHAAFGSLAVRTLGSYGLSLFADNLHCLVEVAFCSGQGVLAVHHTSTGHFAELGYISHCYSHNFFYRFKVNNTLVQKAVES